ncbi:hypothetical protein GGR51DRAFT_543981 [Nemania sp. FL0031]|nr:hypothetical protein GGR51DRAFT_543981 [Nemania sp. FL0031]
MRNFVHNPTGRLQTRTYDTGRRCIGANSVCLLPVLYAVYVCCMWCILYLLLVTTRQRYRRIRIGFSVGPDPLFPVSSSLASRRLIMRRLSIDSTFGGKYSHTVSGHHPKTRLQSTVLYLPIYTLFTRHCLYSIVHAVRHSTGNHRPTTVPTRYFIPM